MILKAFAVFLLLQTTKVTSNINKEGRLWVNEMVQKFYVVAAISDIDTNFDGIVTFEELMTWNIKADENEDGHVQLCEWITFLFVRYRMPPTVSQFTAPDKDGFINFTVLFQSILEAADDDNDRTVTLDEFNTAILQFTKQRANMVYEAINGFVKKDIKFDEVSHRDIASAVKLLDQNKDGFIDTSDLNMAKGEQMMTRCQFVNAHVNESGGTRWVWNKAFELIDLNNDEIQTLDDVYQSLYDADWDKNGRTTVQEVTEYTKAILRSAHLFLGLHYANPWKCAHPESLEPAMRMALDTDHNQDGVLSAKEILVQWVRLVDDNGDSLVQLGEWGDRLVKRYGICIEQAIEMFEEQDINGDYVIDVRSEVWHYSLDVNLDGRITVCEMAHALNGWIQTGAENLKKIRDCKPNEHGHCRAAKIKMKWPEKMGEMRDRFNIYN